MSTKPPPSSPRVPLYEAVADQITQLIHMGTLRPGDRLPSVRALSQQQHVSITTVLEAYRLLENRGLIETRPKAGHYVRAAFAGRLDEPEMSRPHDRPTQVSMTDLGLQILRDMADPNLLPLGAALPNPELLPLEKLSRTLAAAVRDNPASSSTYDLAPGYEPLRIQVARRLILSGCSLSPDAIAITSGCQEAINLCLRAICKPGDTVAIESPIFYGILFAIQSLGLNALEIATHPRDGINLEALASAIEDHPIKACIVVSNFNNPLGSRIPDDSKRLLVEMLAAKDIPLIEDDNYGDLGFDLTRPIVAKSFDRTGNVLLCASFTKTLAPGYRVGWVAAGRYQKQVEYLKIVSNLGTSMPPQLALAAFLAGGGYEQHLRRVRRACAERTAAMAQAVGDHFPAGTRITRPGGGFILWVELPPDVDSVVLYERALSAGISLAPGPVFSATQKYRNFLRLNTSWWSPRTEHAIATLGRLAGKTR